MIIADISLLNQDRLLLLCIITTALMTLVLVKQPAKWYKNRLPFHVLGSAVIGAIAWGITIRLFPEDTIPVALVGWVFLVVFSISLLFTIKRSRNRMIIAVFGACLSILFSFSLVNQYYQYFPTIGSLFDSTGLQSRRGTNQGTFYHTIAQKPSTAIADETAYIPPPDQPSVGKLDTLSIPGALSGFQARPGLIYLPPAALTSNSSLKLPVVILLSGVPGNPGDWKDRVSLASTLDAFASQHHGLAPIAVVADQTGGTGFVNTGCVDSPRGNVETYLTQDVPNYIRSHYNVKTDASAWSIGGISDGAMCSTVLAARHPDLFPTFVSLSGEVVPTLGSKQKTVSVLFDGSNATYKKYDARLLLQDKNAKQKYAHTSGWLGMGRDEQQSLLNANRDLFDIAKGIEVDMTLELLPGHHSFGLWKQSFMDALPWLSHKLNLTS